MFGGTMNVDEVDDHPFLKEDRDLTREAIARGVPFWGSAWARRCWRAPSTLPWCAHP